MTIPITVMALQLTHGTSTGLVTWQMRGMAGIIGPDFLNLHRVLFISLTPRNFSTDVETSPLSASVLENLSFAPQWSPPCQGTYSIRLLTVRWHIP